MTVPLANGGKKPVPSQRDKEVATNFNHLRSCLEKERAQLITQLEQLTASVRQAGGVRETNLFSKWDEGAIKSYEVERCLALQSRVRDNLTAVEHALEKFDRGTYGICDSCDKPIDSARLEVLPRATLCLSCKARQGKKSKIGLSSVSVWTGYRELDSLKEQWAFDILRDEEVL